MTTPPEPSDEQGPPEPIGDSPCIGICTLDAEGRCRGCRRTLAEITDWHLLDETQRDAINRRNLPDAHPAVRVRLLGDAGGRQPRRGGRKARRG